MIDALTNWPGNYPIAWGLLAIVFVYYTIIALVLRIAPRQKVLITQYLPPENISPALAAYLIDNLKSERAFAAAIVSIASKSYLEIQVKADGVVLQRLPKPDQPLMAEEAQLFGNLLPDYADSYSFNGSECSRLCAAFGRFEETLEGIAGVELTSDHAWLWLLGIFFCVNAITFVAIYPLVWKGWGIILGIAYTLAWMSVGVRCVVAAARTWKVTLKKVFTFIPGSERPRRPFNTNDAVPFFLTGTSFFGYVLLVFLTSFQFALILNTTIAMLLIFRHLLDVPTRAGRAALSSLKDYSEYLSRVEADRLSRENLPGRAPFELEQVSAYGIALHADRGWGEDFAENIVEMIETDAGYNWHFWKMPAFSASHDLDNDVIQLNLRARK